MCLSSMLLPMQTDQRTYTKHVPTIDSCMLIPWRVQHTLRLSRSKIHHHDSGSTFKILLSTRKLSPQTQNESLVQKLKKVCRMRWSAFHRFLTVVFKATASDLLKKIKTMKLLNVVYTLHQFFPISS